jgi:hypothetical protein
MVPVNLVLFGFMLNIRRCVGPHTFLRQILLRLLVRVGVVNSATCCCVISDPSPVAATFETCCKHAQSIQKDHVVLLSSAR